MRKFLMVLRTILLAAVLVGLIFALIYGRINNPLNRRVDTQTAASQS